MAVQPTVWVESLLAQLIEFRLVRRRPDAAQLEHAVEGLSIMLRRRVAENRDSRGHRTVVCCDMPTQVQEPVKREITQLPGLETIDSAHAVRSQKNPQRLGVSRRGLNPGAASSCECSGWKPASLSMRSSSSGARN